MPVKLSRGSKFYWTEILMLNNKKLEKYFILEERNVCVNAFSQLTSLHTFDDYQRHVLREIFCWNIDMQNTYLEILFKILRTMI